MREIITLQKEIAFKTMIGDICSISLEHDLEFINDCEIEGNLIISGTYKMTEASTLEEEFNYKIPVEIMLTTNLLEDNRKIDIKNFIYNIVNDEQLEINVELLIEGIEKIEIEDDIEEELTMDLREKDEDIEVLKTDIVEPFTNDINPDTNIVEKISDEEKVVLEKQEDIVSNNEVMDSIFSAFANTRETYSTYSIYILRDDDSLEDVLTKYKITKDELGQYNDLDNLKVGSKLIIPSLSLEVNE